LAVEGAGASWDIAWHGDIGRDRFLTPPHVLIVMGIAGAGLSCLVGVLVASRGGRLRDRIVATPGLAVAGSAVALQGLGLAVDNWWHGIFGIDVTLWSPPHLLLLALGYLAVVGLMAEYASRADASPWALSVWAGGLLGGTTVLLAEYDLGFPHFALFWSAPVLAGCLGLGLGLARRASGLRWAGLLATSSALAIRLVGVAINALAHRSVPVPPVGIVLGGLLFDMALRRRGGEQDGGRARLVVAAVTAWCATFPVEAVWSRLLGKTWWPTATLPVAFALGLLAVVPAVAAGAFLADRLSGRTPHLATRALRRAMRPVTAVVVTATAGLALVAGLTYRPLPVGALEVRAGSRIEARPAAFIFNGSTASLWIRDGHNTDWVSVFRLPFWRGQALRWIGGLTWRGAGRFDGAIRLHRPARPPRTRHRGGIAVDTLGGPPGIERVGLWLVSDGHAWFGFALAIPPHVGVFGYTQPLLELPTTHLVHGTSPPATPTADPSRVDQITLYRASSQPPRPVPAWLSPIAYALVLSLLVGGLWLAIGLLSLADAKAGMSSLLPS
jgi:hypothetical protein